MNRLFLDPIKEGNSVRYGDFTVTPTMVDPTKVRIDIVVNKGAATPEQLVQIRRAQEYAQSKGMGIRIFETE